MFDKSVLEELRRMLANINVSDDHMARGVRLTSNAMNKVAARFHIDVSKVPDLLVELSRYMSDELVEDAARFGYERDYMGNITINDSKTGKSKFIQGDSAFKLGDELAANPDKEEAIIANYFDVSVLSEADEDMGFPDKGTFNFPYKGKFATASYGLENGKFTLKVISLRTETDEEIELTPLLQKELDRVAMTWIDKV